jgi:hypothetical protein
MFPFTIAFIKITEGDGCLGANVLHYIYGFSF